MMNVILELVVFGFWVFSSRGDNFILLFWVILIKVFIVSEGRMWLSGLIVILKLFFLVWLSLLVMVNLNRFLVLFFLFKLL